MKHGVRSLDGCFRLDLAVVRRLGILKPGKHGAETRLQCSVAPALQIGLVTTIAIEGSSNLEIIFERNSVLQQQSVAITAVPMRFGGHRWYAVCPVTLERCSTLDMPWTEQAFASRKAWQLPYGSQLEGELDRAIRKHRRLRVRNATLSKYARRHTRVALEASLYQVQDAIHCLLEERRQNMRRRLSRFGASS